MTTTGTAHSPSRASGPARARTTCCRRGGFRGTAGGRQLHARVGAGLGYRVGNAGTLRIGLDYDGQGHAVRTRASAPAPSRATTR